MPKKPTSFIRDINLTLRQRRFARAYATHGNATQAAQDAGYSGDRNTLKSVGNENLTKPDIVAAIDWYAEPLWELAADALREILQDSSNQNARVRAAALLAKMEDRLAPHRVEHIHAHALVDFTDLTDPDVAAEAVRVISVVLRNLPEPLIARVLDEVGKGHDLLKLVNSPKLVPAKVVTNP